MWIKEAKKELFEIRTTYIKTDGRLLIVWPTGMINYYTDPLNHFVIWSNGDYRVGPIYRRSAQLHPAKNS